MLTSADILLVFIYDGIYHKDFHSFLEYLHRRGPSREVLGAILKPQESLAQIFTTPGNSLESEVPTGKTMDEYHGNILHCWQDYKGYMDSIKEDGCDWAKMTRPYSYLQDCLEKNAEYFGLGFPNELAEEFIFETHLTHFATCSLVQPTFSDPPEDVLLAIAPICLIPFLVTLVVWRSKGSEAQTQGVWAQKVILDFGEKFLYGGYEVHRKTQHFGTLTYT
ncbi:receptor activity-modifying protein 2-like [Molossus molossus]|uniref:receptor activity-modifying protein 2-like n=1 Tax=Molossus molossus TaxID=27622 RepID=UPI0017465BB6|nr:receptor activity-modifying protein 2-like [Molossus molossus]